MIELTDNAACQVNRMLSGVEEGKLLRIYVEPGGCSGFEYAMSVDFPKEDDLLGESRGVRYALAADSFDYLKGSEVHFDDGLAGKGFEIRNPNAQSSCGCGKSFS